MNSEKEINKMMDQISLEAPMLKYLLTKGIPFDDEQKAYKLKHCEKRSTDNPYACEHGLMDLHVDTWRDNHFQIVSVCFYYLQNGDMMRDPDIVFRFNKSNLEVDQRFLSLGLTPNQDMLMEIPLSYRLDSMGIFHETYDDPNSLKSKMNLKLIRELQGMLEDTVRHCRTWNYYLEDAEK